MMRLLTHKLPQKLLSLVLATVVYFIATADQRATSERSFEVPIQVVDTSPRANQRDVSDIPRTIRVTLSGPLNRLEALESDRIEVNLDVSNTPTGRFQGRVEVSNPSGTDLVSYTPQVVTGLIDEVVTLGYPVRITHLNSQEQELLRFTANPAAVKVTGARNRVESIATVITQPVAYTENDVRQVALIPIDAQGHEVLDVRLAPRSVQVSRVDSGILPIKKLPVRLESKNPKLLVEKVTFNPSTVRLLGDAENLSTMEAVQASVPLKAGTYTTQVRLNLPASVTSLDRVTATLIVREKP